MFLSQGPPLDPSAAQAREWVVDELAKPDYAARTDPVRAVLEWIFDHLGGGVVGGIGAGGFAFAVVAVLLVMALVLVAGLGRRRRVRPVGAAGALQDEEGVSAAVHRERARAAWRAGDPDLALVEAVRALAARSVERVLVEELPGRTAHELSAGLAPVFPSYAARLTELADEFDSVRYGHGHVDSAQASAALDLEATLDRTRPRREVPA